MRKPTNMGASVRARLLTLARQRRQPFQVLLTLDIWVLSKSHALAGDELARAIRATFDRRKTVIPADPPDCLTQEFAGDTAKMQQWSSFVADVASKPGSLADVVADLALFLMPHAMAAKKIKT